MKASTLVLSASFEPLVMVDWRRAICLVLSRKAEAIAEYGREARSPSVRIKVPKIVRLLDFAAYVGSGYFTRFSRRNVLLRDRFTCVYCKKRLPLHSLTIDHVTPRGLGGQTSWDNVVAACYECNGRKGCRTPEEAGMQLSERPRRPSVRAMLGDGLVEALELLGGDWAES